MTRTVDLLIESRWIAPVEPEGLLEDHAVAIDSGRIVAVLPTNEARRHFRALERVELLDHLLIPGLIFDTPMIEQVLEVMRLSDFRQAIKLLGGYSTRETGQLVPLN